MAEDTPKAPEIPVPTPIRYSPPGTNDIPPDYEKK